jgi:hypothetical protein
MYIQLNMIYLILTTSLHNRISGTYAEQREERYKDCISKTLSYLPEEIQPIIVENNNNDKTFLDSFQHYGKSVPVVYTDNNKYLYKNKGVNELVDIKEVILKRGIQNDDMIIKLTGRYCVTSASFFNEVIENKNKFDAFVKFYGSCSLKYEMYDCILGMYAMRAINLQLLNVSLMNNYDSPEIGFARYVRMAIYRFKEMKQLDLECLFAEDGRILYV